MKNKPFHILQNQILSDKKSHRQVIYELTEGVSGAKNFFMLTGVSYAVSMKIFAPWVLERNSLTPKKHLNLFWIRSGMLLLETGEGNHTVSAGQFLIIPSWVERRLSVASRMCDHVYARIDMPERYPHIQEVLIKPSSCGDKIHSCIQILSQGLPLPGKYGEEYFRLYFQLLVLLMNYELDFSPEHEVLLTESISKILMNVSIKSLTVRTLAEKLAVSESALYLHCTRFYGKNPSSLLAEYKLHEAANLLANTEKPVYGIAKELGYANQFSFSRAFKRLYEVAPSQYRRNMKAVAKEHGLITRLPHNLLA